MNSKEILAADLEAARAPADMVQRARDGYYSDYDSPLAMPCVQLVTDARRHGLYAIARQATEGKYDATQEESEAWAKRTYETDPEMRKLMDDLGLGPRT